MSAENNPNAQSLAARAEAEAIVEPRAANAALIAQRMAYHGCFSFGAALFALKQGQRVARQGWNGKGMWLMVVEADEWQFKEETYLDAKGEHICRAAVAAWIGMKTADGRFVPWLASQTDMLAEDWVVVP